LVPLRVSLKADAGFYSPAFHVVSVKHVEWRCTARRLPLQSSVRIFVDLLSSRI
jgi:hypothetical protein